MSLVSVASLFVAATKDAILSKGLQIATAYGLPTETWAEGDPTLTDFYFISEMLESLEQVLTIFIASGFLDTATGDALKVKAYQDFNVEVPEATFATCSVRMTNTGGGAYAPAAGDLTYLNTSTGKTYRNTTGGTLIGVGSTLTVDVVADEAGSDSSAAIGEIDAMVTVLRGVTVTNTTAAVGQDEQSEQATREQCRDKLGALSPNGPRDAYVYVAKNHDLTGTTGITRARTYGDSTTGVVTGYFAGPSGAVSTVDRDLARAAILLYATPLCITPTFSSATNVVVPITYQLWVYAADSRELDQIEDAVEDALELMFLARPIGGDIIPPDATGKLYQSLIEATIRSASTYSFRVLLTLPVADVALSLGEVAALGTITATITKVADP